MKIEKYEQSGFVIENNSGFRLAFDIGNKTSNSDLAKVGRVDAFIVSHIHGDHFDIQNIKSLKIKNLFLNAECLETLGEESFNFKINVVEVGDTIFIDDMTVTFFNVDHGPNVSAPLKENFGFLLNVDGQNIYFAGDMFYESGIDVSSLEVDLALLPVGTFYTFGPEEAFIFAKKFKKIGKIISMHYDKTPETHEKFIALSKESFQVE
ncbi:MAG: MBL fold metallo-hydrolase [Candidatus Nomurabacteria bacterium]|nr:MBL fold metallo-hydrolase [Candidatus Nomurabacteria bacterium]